MAGVYGIMVGGVRSGGTALQNSHTTGIGTPWGLTVTSSVVPVIGAWSIGTRIGNSCARAVAGASAGVTVSIAFGAAIPVEVVCDYPGLGQLAWKAALARDVPLLVNLTLIIALVFVFVNLLVDMSYAYLDPRVRLS